MVWPFNNKYPEHRPEDADLKSYDYVIVGGGTAGCVLASRLSEDPNISVLLLERGPVNDTFMSRIPLASCNIMNPESGAVSWESEPMKHCGNRRNLFVGAEILGGCSRVNGMIYTRGTAADYDGWAAMGHTNWSFEKVLPYFVKMENSLNQPKSSYRGKEGPLVNQSTSYSDWLFKAYRVFSDCAETMGFVRIPDANSPDAPVNGIADLDLSVSADGQRVSTFAAYLPKEIALQRKENLTICTNSIVSQIKFSNDDVPRAEQVLFKYADQSSPKTFSAKVNREVIVSSGAIGSPQVLLLSGIGPRKHLEELGIEVVRDLPGVGSGLTDHIGLPVAWEVPMSESLTAIGKHPLTKGLLEFLKYIISRQGILSKPCQALSLFVHSSSLNDTGTELISNPTQPTENKTLSQLQVQMPDIELMPLTTSTIDDLTEWQTIYSKIGIFSILATLLQPTSRGSIHLSTTSPHSRPKIDLGIFSSPSDLLIARKAVHLSLKLGQLMKSQGFPLIRNVTFPDEERNEDIDRFIREKARTTFHYSGSCGMGRDGSGVVDGELRVWGVEGLRVCDASVFPGIVSSHLQVPVIMVAERCADFVKEAAKAL